MFGRKRNVTCVNLADVIQVLSMNASQLEYNGEISLCTPWEELTVSELLDWMKEENVKMSYEFRKGVEG